MPNVSGLQFNTELSLMLKAAQTLITAFLWRLLHHSVFVRHARWHARILLIESIVLQQIEAMGFDPWYVSLAELTDFDRFVAILRPNCTQRLQSSDRAFLTELCPVGASSRRNVFAAMQLTGSIPGGNI